MLRSSVAKASVCGLTIYGVLSLSPLAFGQQGASKTLLPRTIVNASNAPGFFRFLAPAAELGLKYGMTMRVVPTTRIDWSEGFTSATEKYSPQVALDKDDYLTNYIAGMPFPTVSTTDPKAAIKIAYIWHIGPFMPDDFSLEPWGSFAYTSVDSPNSFAPTTRRATSVTTSPSFAVRIARRSIRAQPWARRATVPSPRLVFRSLAPAHGGITQKINTGSLSEDQFDQFSFFRN